MLQRNSIVPLLYTQVLVENLRFHSIPEELPE